MSTWTPPPQEWKRMYHPMFGWGRMDPRIGTKGNTLFYPEQAVEWNTAAPPIPYRRDRVEENEPIHLPVAELRETDAPHADDLLSIALQVKRFPRSPEEGTTPSLTTK